MTNDLTTKEAIEVLSDWGVEIRDYCDGGKHMGDRDRQTILALDKAIQALKSSIHLPSGATNGDVIKAAFPDIKCWVLTDHKEIIALNYKEVVDWWNAPYREGDASE